MVFFLLLLTIPIILIFILSKIKNGRKTINLPPGPPGLPFIGNLHQFDAITPHLYFYKLSKKYGKIMSLKFGSVPVIVVSSAKLAEEVTKTQDLVFCSRPSVLGQQKLSYNGLDIAFAPYNDYWKEMRKVIVVHLYSQKKVQSFGPIREDEVSRMIKKISQQADACEITNLSSTILLLTSTIICRVAFGIRYDEGTHERKRLDQLLNQIQSIMGDFFISDYFPLIGWIDKLSGMMARLEKKCKGLDEFYEELIELHLNPNRPKSMEGDILDLLLQLRKEQSTPIDLTLDTIKALLMNVMAGGTDTTAASIVWTMTALIKNPKAMKKVQAEVRDVVGSKGMINEADIQKLSYFKAVIKEAYRLYPPVTLLLPRETMEKSLLDGFEIEPKTVVYVNYWAIARDPEYWENPEEFIPERFLNSDIDFKGQNFEYIPFGSGRRGCPGVALGVATVELVLSNLIYAFDWELPDGMKIEDIDTDVIPGLAMHKKNALCLVPKSYK